MLDGVVIPKWSRSFYSTNYYFFPPKCPYQIIILYLQIVLSSDIHLCLITLCENRLFWRGKNGFLAHLMKGKVDLLQSVKKKKERDRWLGTVAQSEAERERNSLPLSRCFSAVNGRGHSFRPLSCDELTSSCSSTFSSFSLSLHLAHSHSLSLSPSLTFSLASTYDHWPIFVLL